MVEFHTDDKIICIDNHAVWTLLKVGEIYTVQSHSWIAKSLVVREEGGVNFRANRFIPLTEASKALYAI